MIYQLLRLEWGIVWRARLVLGLLFVGIVSALLIVIRHAGMPQTLFSMMTSWVLIPTVVVLFLAFGGGRRATVFQAALPIPARDFFMTRLVCLLGVVWVLVLFIAGASYVVGGDASSIPALPLIAAGVVATTAGLVLLSVRLRELGAPRVLAIWFPLPFVLIGTVNSFIRPGVVLAVGAAISTALLWRDFASMPKAFHVAPADAVAERTSRISHGSPRPVWWLVWRSMLAKKPLNILLLSVVYLLSPVLSPAAGLMLAGFLTRCWAAMQWLWALPVSRRKVLALTLLPPLVMEAVVQAAKPAGFVQMIELVTAALLCTSCSLAIINRRRTRAPAILGAAGLTVFFCGLFKLMLVDLHTRGFSRKHFWGSYTAEYLGAHLARMPPPLHLIVIAGTLVALGALYWLVQRQFEATDFLPAPQIRLGAAEFSSGSDA